MNKKEFASIESDVNLEKDFDIEIGKVLNWFEVPTLERPYYRHDKGKMYSDRLRYDWETGKILLPNSWKFVVEYYQNKKEIIDKLKSVGVQRLPYDLMHEIMHKYLRENVSEVACEKWDNIDKIIGSNDYKFSNPDSNF